MTVAEIKKMLDEIGLPHRYHHFTQKEMKEVNLPILVWQVPGTSNFFADGQTYLKIKQLEIEIYTDEKDWELEEKVEGILSDYGIAWEQTASEYLQSESMWESLYEMEV